MPPPNWKKKCPSLSSFLCSLLKTINFLINVLLLLSTTLVIESIHLFYIVRLLTMMLFIKLFWYKERVLSLFFKKYCECNIYALVSNVKILTISKAMDRHLLGDVWIELQCVCVCVCACVRVCVWRRGGEGDGVS